MHILRCTCRKPILGFNKHLGFLQHKLVYSLKKGGKEKISFFSFFFYRKLQTVRYLFKRQELFPRAIPVAFRALSVFLFVWKNFNICPLLFTFKSSVSGSVTV